MGLHDGNGWVDCRCGARHWGRHGAAGLLLVDRVRAGVLVLLQLRAGWTHQGGTWGLPGGARDSHEDTVSAALREAHEEVGVDPDSVRVLFELLGTDHGDWSYTYVAAAAEPDLRVEIRSAESDELRWVSLDDVPALGLHPALGQAWPTLRRALADTFDRRPDPRP